MPNEARQKTNRRAFLKKAGAAGATLVAAPYFVPATAFGANERIIMGIIGPGGRGRSVMKEFQDKGAVFAAVAEIYKPNLEAGVKQAKNTASQVTAYEDWRDLLEKQKDLNAVLIATPEHQHGVQLIATVKAGFDSYCEKPMSHSIEEGNKIVREVRKTNKIVQIGMQRRSTPFVRRGKELMDTGLLGPVHFVRVKWNWSNLNNGFIRYANERIPEMEDAKLWKMFCAPHHVIEYEPIKFARWRWFWAFSGGNITDQGTHLMDVVQWYMSEEMNPVTPHAAECFGDVYFIRDPKTNKPVETPDVFTSIFKYPDRDGKPGFTANWTLDYTTSYQNSWSIEFMGEKATMALDDKGLRVYDEPWDPAQDSMLESKKAPVKMDKGGLESISHVANFLDCVKTRKQPNAPVEIGHKAVCGPHLANVAYKRKERAYLNDSATHVNRDWF